MELQWNRFDFLLLTFIIAFFTRREALSLLTNLLEIGLFCGLLWLLYTAVKAVIARARNAKRHRIYKMGLKNNIKGLRKALTDYRFYKDAIMALEKIGNEQAIKALLSVLHHRYEEISRVLRKMNASCLIQLLTEALGSPDADQRKSAAKLMGEIGGSWTVEPLILALKDYDLDVRKQSAEALGKIGDKCGVIPLIELLKDNLMVVTAIIALGNIGGEAAVLPLVSVLERGGSKEGPAAAEALGKIGDKQAVEALIEALKSSHSGLRKNAAWALKRIGDSRAEKALESFEAEERAAQESLRVLLVMKKPAILSRMRVLA